jgi:hypothetical protein
MGMGIRDDISPKRRNARGGSVRRSAEIPAVKAKADHLAGEHNISLD